MQADEKLQTAEATYKNNNVFKLNDPEIGITNDLLLDVVNSIIAHITGTGKMHMDINKIINTDASQIDIASQDLDSSYASVT